MRHLPSKQGVPSLLSRLSVLLFLTAALVLASLLWDLYDQDNVQVFRLRPEAGFARITDYVFQEEACPDAPAGVVQSYTFSLDPSLAHDAHLAFYAVHQAVAVYLDGQLVYRLAPTRSPEMGRTVGSNWVMLPLYHEDVGKEVRVEITPAYESFRERRVELLLGSPLSIYADRLTRDLPQLAISLLAVFVGLVFLCVAAYDLLRKKRYSRLAWLGLLSIMMGLWRLTDTRFTPFLAPDKPVLLFCLSVTMMMLAIIPLIKSLEETLSPELRPILNLCCMGAALAGLAQLLLQRFGVMDLRENLTLTHLTIILCALVLFSAVLWDRRRHPGQIQHRVGEGLPFICAAGALADIAAFYIKGNSSGLLFSLASFLLYAVFTGISMVYNYNEQEKLLLEKEVELADSRIVTMLSQIQPHFLYNSLSTIRSLCRRNPEQAWEALGDFSAYLRGNTESLTAKGNVPFLTELNHVETYLKLEKLRMGDTLQVVFDIGERDFYLPCLTVQPLVENAVKHGLFHAKAGGTLTLRTCRAGDNIQITVEDDGVGFDPKAPMGPDRTQAHVGIRNVRYRLEKMAGASLTIESQPGQGTRATILLPSRTSLP